MAEAKSAGQAPAKDAPEGTWLHTWSLSDGGANPAPLPGSREGTPSLLVRSAPSSVPWEQFIGRIAPAVPLAGGQQNQGALIFQPVDDDVVVWSFGNAWPLLDPSKTVERFGLIAGLNALLTSPAPTGENVKAIGVRELTAAVRASVVKKSTVHTARPSRPVSMERLDRTSDAASGAGLSTHHATFGRCVAGRSLRFEALVSGLDDLQQYAKEAIRLFRMDDYSKSPDYGWIDFTIPVVNREEIDAVLDELWSSELNAQTSEVALVWADTEPESGLTPSYVCLPGERVQSLKRPNLPWEAAKNWLVKYRLGEPGRSVLRSKVRFHYDDLSAGPRYEIWQLIAADVVVGATSYFLSDGEVWRVSQNHVADIDAALHPHVVVNPPFLPRYVSGETEAAYNARAASEKKHFLMDKQLVKLSGETPFEPCDLFAADGRLMHVKRRTRSSTMSHVLTQATAATRLLRTEAEARAKVDEVLAKKPQHAAAATLRSHVQSFGASPTGKVSVVIVGDWRNTPEIAQLPLMTRIALAAWLRDIPCDREIVLVGGS